MSRQYGSSTSALDATGITIGAKKSPRTINPDEVVVGFFYDDKIIRNLNKHGLDVARSHLQLLVTSEGDEHLQISFLLEGRTVEFLFGPHGLARAMNTKNLLKGLREIQQAAAVKFYIDLYSAVIRYHSETSTCAYFQNIFSSKDSLDSDIDVAFENFRLAIRTGGIYQDS